MNTIAAWLLSGITVLCVALLFVNFGLSMIYVTRSPGYKGFEKLLTILLGLGFIVLGTGVMSSVTFLVIETLFIKGGPM